MNKRQQDTVTDEKQTDSYGVQWKERLLERENLPYQNNREYLKDCFQILMLLMEKVETLYVYTYLKKRELITLDTGFQPIFLKLCNTLQVTDFEKFCILFSLSTYENFYFSRFFSTKSKDSNVDFPTIGIAMELYRQMQYVDTQELLEQIEQPQVLSKRFLYWLEESREGAVLQKQIKTSEGLYRMLYGKSVILQVGEGIVRREDALKESDTRIIVNQERIDELTRLITAFMNSDIEKDCILNLCGEEGIGRKYALKIALSRSERSGITIVDLAAMSALSPEKQMEWLHDIPLEIMQSGNMLVVEHVSEPWEEEERQLLLRLADQLGLLAVLTPKPLEGGSFQDKILFPIEFKEYQSVESVALWKHFLSDYCDQDLNLDVYGNNYHYSAGHIKRLAYLTRLEAMKEGRQLLDEIHLQRALRKQKTNVSTSFLTLQNCTFTREDLMLAEEEERVLLNLCNQVKYRNVVNEEWGMAGKLPYGKGIAILLYGPPGTGKSMSAQVIASELKLDLYRVDLSQILSKYIGETEKYLSEAFEIARKNSAILFFDEADSLFTKRTQVNDSKDKFANNETSYLLQKMEEYDGVTILATNYLGNIDNAFKRRFQYILGINAPDAQIRLKIWKSVFPPYAPIAKDVHLEELARQFEFTGSSIKSVARAASYLAAAQKEPINKRHLTQAIKDELVKNGRPIDAANIIL